MFDHLHIPPCVPRESDTIKHVVSVSGGKDTPGGDGSPVQIDEVVRWSKTRRGARQFDMMAYFAPPTSGVCVYAGGLCE